MTDQPPAVREDDLVDLRLDLLPGVVAHASIWISLPKRWGPIGFGLVEERLISGEAPAAAAAWDAAGPAFVRRPAGRAGKLRDRVAEGGFSVTVLDGVTGSSSFLSALIRAFHHVRNRRLHTGSDG